MNKVYYSTEMIKGYAQNIIRSMMFENWRPDYIVGLTRGGLVPATMISHYLNIPLHTLNVSLRDNVIGPESNLWMAEDAFGYHNVDGLPSSSNPALRKNILIVDDINDTGATLNWIQDDWPSGCLPTDSAWQNIWNKNVRFAVLINNTASEFKNIDYAGKTINKLDCPEWVVFPWENWWE